MSEWQLTIDCNEPSRLVSFWANVLGYVIQDAPAGFATWNERYLSVGVSEDELDLDGDGSDRIVDPHGRGPRIWFQKVPEAKAGKNRLHLDVYVGGGPDTPVETRRSRVDARVAELVDIGATVDHVTDEAEHGRYFVVLLDPEGNELCLA